MKETKWKHGETRSEGHRQIVSYSQDTFKSSTSVGVISDGSISGAGREEKAPLALAADGVGLTIPAH